MSDLSTIILAAALSLPAAQDASESVEVRSSRLGIIAVACAEAANRAVTEERWAGTTRELAVLLLVKAYWESGLVRRIHAGQCRPWECDVTKRGHHRARGLWQLHNTPLMEPGEWRRVAGIDLESTRSGAWAAARILSEGRRRCGWRKGAEIEGTIAWYARSKCYWRGAKRRAWMYKRLMIATQSAD